jgi:2-polyprenyl-3-methyl-5-hydroxy-6-metoxy-1,4-benzoquinol methylase
MVLNLYYRSKVITPLFKSMECSICHFHDSSSSYLNLYDDRYGYPGRFAIFQCLLCGHKQLKADFTSDQLLELYSNYYPRSSFDLQQYKPHQEVSGFNAWLNGDYCSAYLWIPKNVRVLDIGCGFGESLGYYTARGCEAYGVEADINIERIAQTFNLNIHVGLFKSDVYESNFFDYITLDQVIEHAVNPVQMLCDIAQVLKPGGKVILSTPNSRGWGVRAFGRRWINWHTPYHLQHFSEESMQLAAEQAGLILESAKTITHSNWLYYQWIHLALFPEMGHPSVFWSPGLILGLREKIWVKMISVIHQTKINHLLTRLFDGFGLGDNYLFILVKP